MTDAPEPISEAEKIAFWLEEFANTAAVEEINTLLARTVIQVHPHITGAEVPIDKPLFDLDGRVIPTYFDPRKLLGLSRFAMGWFNKTHPDVIVGSGKTRQ